MTMENDAIAQYLAALEREDRYRVDATLKESSYEVTQRVYFADSNGNEQGPFIRKLISRESGMGAAYKRIFEAQQAGCVFKHIPVLTECYYDESYLVVVMEFVPGETLQDAVYRRDPSPEFANEVFPLACDAVSELHEAFDPPLIHRDLKPSNIMISGNRLTIIDFGIARLYKQGAEADTEKFGTRAFAPPEQYGFGQTTVQSDVYALGMLLYYCLTEKIPTQRIREMGFQAAGIPSDLRPVLVRATALDATERYGSAAELRSAFLEAIARSDKPPDADEAGKDAPTQTPSNEVGGEGAAKRQRTWLVAACVVAAAVIALVAAFGLSLSGGGSVSNSSSGSASADSLQAESTTNETTSSSQSSSGGVSSDAAPVNASEKSAGASNASSEADAAFNDTRSATPQRDDFNPETNIPVVIAGVQFQIPHCFGARVDKANDKLTYYYAESGSTLAMIMASETPLESHERNAEENGEPTSQDAGGSSSNSTEEESGNLTAIKDEFLAGLAGSDSAFETLVSVTDFELAQHSARIATFTGTTQGLPVSIKAVYFLDQDTSAIGLLFFGQTDNSQFDYFSDFEKTIASATVA